VPVVFCLTSVPPLGGGGALSYAKLTSAGNSTVYLIEEYRNWDLRFDAGLASSENIFGRDRACLGMFTLSFLILSFIYCRERGFLTQTILQCPLQVVLWRSAMSLSANYQPFVG